MKKITWATHKGLFGQIASSTCLLAASAGVVFGISAGTFKVQYFNLNDADARLLAAQSTNTYSQNISSQWNMNEKRDKDGKVLIPAYEKPLFQDISSGEGATWWQKLHGDDAVPLHKSYLKIDPSKMEISAAPGTDISADASEMRMKYGSLVIDGATHTALDRSFNQSLYNGMANFITNKKHSVTKEGEATVYKPSQDSTQEFVNIYREAVQHSRILCLAGFNHVTPLNALGKQNGAVFDFGQDKNIKNAGMLLIDGDVANNQNIASILFRSDQPGFLAALSTCMYFLHNLDIYHENYKDLSVACYGGTAIPTVMVYMGGFQRGVEFFNEFILRQRILNIQFKVEYLGQGGLTSEFLGYMINSSKYKDEIEQYKGKEPDPAIREELIKKLYDEYSVKIIKLGGLNTNFSGSFASGDAIGITKQFLNRGASAIIAVAGPQSLDSAQEIMNQNKSTIVIGVDTAMENSDYQKPYKNKNFTDKTKAPDGSVSAQAGNIIKFSAVKDMTSVSEKVLRLAAEGKNWDITIKDPWTSTQEIPYWDVETEEIPVSSLEVATGETERGIKIFDVIGLKTLPKEKQHVLHIPGSYTKDGVTYRLNAIRVPKGTETVANKFGPASLKNVDTLIISSDGRENASVTLNENAFGFDKATPQELETSGFRYIDISDFETTNIDIPDIYSPFNGMVRNEKSYAYGRGVIKFIQGAKGAKAPEKYKALFPGDEIGTQTRWGTIEADPYKSIASFGFKTCGNIENGLISISWDGWSFLVDALKQLKYAFPDGEFPGEMPFLSAWQFACARYQQEGIEGIDEFFEKNLDSKLTVEDMCTFDTNSVWCKYYPHTMAVLGRLLKYSANKFDGSMTIKFNEKGEPVKLADDEEIQMSILDWLKMNMYFIS